MRVTICINYRHFGFKRRHRGNPLERISKAAIQAFEDRCIRWRDVYSSSIAQYLIEHGVPLTVSNYYVTCKTQPVPGPKAGPVQIYVSGDSGGRDWRREDNHAPIDIANALKLCWAANALFWAEWPEIEPKAPLEWNSYEKG
jgi:hypothetical protein